MMIKTMMEEILSLNSLALEALQSLEYEVSYAILMSAVNQLSMLPEENDDSKHERRHVMVEEKEKALLTTNETTSETNGKVGTHTMLCAVHCPLKPLAQSACDQSPFQFYQCGFHWTHDNDDDDDLDPAISGTIDSSSSSTATTTIDLRTLSTIVLYNAGFTCHLLSLSDAMNRQQYLGKALYLYDKAFTVMSIRKTSEDDEDDDDERGSYDEDGANSYIGLAAANNCIHLLEGCFLVSAQQIQHSLDWMRETICQISNRFRRDSSFSTAARLVKASSTMSDRLVVYDYDYYYWFIFFFQSNLLLGPADFWTLAPAA